VEQGRNVTKWNINCPDTGKTLASFDSEVEGFPLLGHLITLRRMIKTAMANGAAK